ncbi:hypothetical protein B0T18DRAFT_369780 [Schizothecium vesticola]|uniref:Uncharacterized protein n=1 Tax=Schizothecium vesticola TaxID=314040 RepID=A0AA40EWY6_9PEZI|nr:hypothetical protein B0T18DRAFT_369780 [Schizothecium vesticola]
MSSAAAASAAGRPATPASRQGMFQCGLCSSQYKRLDHLSRHVRSHTQTKPYQCHVCAKAFGRTDLLKRHLAAHGVDNGPNRRQAARALRDTPVRVSQACRACATNHLRCSEPKPCRRCIERETECVWSPINAGLDSGMGGYPMMSPLDGGFSGPGGDHSDGNHLSDGQDTLDQDLDDTLSGPTSSLPTSVSQLASLFPLRVDQSFIPGQWSTLGSPDFDFVSSMDLDDLDLRFLSQYNANVPFAFEGYPDVMALAPPAPPYPDCGEVPASNTPSTHQTPLPSEAFRQAYWKFQPNSQDRGGTEEVHLSLPAGAPHSASPESRVPLDRRVTCRKLGIAARDSIVALVVKRCRPENQARAMASFPSVELLDTLLQYYLTSSVAQADSFLHVPTFDPNSKRPELLAAMAAAGAVLTADPTLTKLGFAIQECVRTALPLLWESDNSLVRSLELSQAHLISLEIALWSGHGRKVEIAESFLQSLITMLRRGGRLRLSGYSPPSPGWAPWIRQESFKRLAFRALQHDSHSSLALLAPPLVSYAELTLPFPSPPDLWSAPSAAAWSALHHQPPAAVINLPSYFSDPSVLSTGAVDTALARAAFLSALWSLAWEHISLTALQRACPRRWNALLTASRLEELLRLLHHFRLGMEPHAPGNVDLVLRLEHMSMHLHAPFEEVHVFAGMEGPGEVGRGRGAVAAWAGTEGGRQAVWHAGQVVRVARLWEGRRGQGVGAVMVYHAALVLWAWGVVMRGRGAGGEFCLEEADGLAVQRFTQFGSGVACVRGEGGRGGVPLTRPEEVMGVVVGVLKGNHEGMGMPPLVDRLVQLMEAVGQSARGGGGGRGMRGEILVVPTDRVLVRLFVGFSVLNQDHFRTMLVFQL